MSRINVTTSLRRFSNVYARSSYAPGLLSLQISSSRLAPSTCLSLYSTPIRHRSNSLLRPADVPEPKDFGSVPENLPSTHLSMKTPMEFIASVPPIEVDGDIAVCDGGHPSLGHPIEYLQLNRVHPNTPETCKYCGLRFVQRTKH